MDTKKELDYKLVNEAFESEGWVMYHQFMAGNRYVKGNDTVTWYFGRFRLNGESVSEAYICEMLHMDSRMIQVCCHCARFHFLQIRAGFPCRCEMGGRAPNQQTRKEK